MPIHDQGYRRYAGSKAAVGRGWSVITRVGVRSMFAKRAFVGLLLMAWTPFVVRAVQIYIEANFAQAASVLAVRADTFRQFLDQQSGFVFFITIYVGAGLIANDRRANALQVYLSKPLTRAEYVAGKAAILFIFLTLVTWVPAIALLIVKILFAGSFTFLRDNIFLLPAITLFCVLQVLLATMTMLALSSMSKSSRFVGVMYAGLMFFTLGIFQFVRNITNSSAMLWLSPTESLKQIGDAIFRMPLSYNVPSVVAFAGIIGLIALSGVILERCVRGVEVVQ
jgi:ABC-2 type transport system permease protein